MADGSAALGAPEIAGALVNPKGGFKKMAAGGIVGINAIEKLRKRGPDELPNFGRVGYVCASDSEVALVKTQTGALKMKVTDQALARAPRSEVATAELDGGLLLSKLRIEFKDGTMWEFDVPKAGKKKAAAFVEAIGGRVH